jgi:hypothetical protein
VRNSYTGLCGRLARFNDSGFGLLIRVIDSWFAPAFSPVAARDCQAGPKGAMAARGTGAMGGSIVPGSSQNARTYGTAHDSSKGPRQHLGADTLVISPGSRNALRACTQWPSAGPRLLKITQLGDTNLLPSLCMYCPP